MTIPGRGDLSPRRKHRDWRQRLAVVGVVLVVAGLGFGGYRVFGGGSSSSPAVLPPCPSVSPQPPSALRAKVAVRNATLKTGLAADVARQLRQREFRIGKIGNTLFRGKGVATVRYSSDRVQSARLVAAQFDGATLAAVTGSAVLEVDIGPKFRELVPIEQALAAQRAILEPATPSPSEKPSPTCSPRPANTTS